MLWHVRLGSINRPRRCFLTNHLAWMSSQGCAFMDSRVLCCAGQTLQSPDRALSAALIPPEPHTQLSKFSSPRWPAAAVRTPVPRKAARLRLPAAKEAGKAGRHAPSYMHCWAVIGSGGFASFGLSSKFGELDDQYR